MYFKVPKPESEQDIDVKYFAAYKDLNKSKSKSKENQLPSAEKPESIASRESTKRLESILRYSDTKERKSESGKRDSISIAPETKEIAAQNGTAEQPATIPEAEVEAEPDGVPVPASSQLLLQPSAEHHRESVR